MKYCKEIILALALGVSVAGCSPVFINVGAGHAAPPYSTSEAPGNYDRHAESYRYADSRPSNLSFESAQRHSDISSLKRIRLHKAMDRLTSGPQVSERQRYRPRTKRSKIKRRKVVRRYY